MKYIPWTYSKLCLAKTVLHTCCYIFCFQLMSIAHANTSLTNFNNIDPFLGDTPSSIINQTSNSKLLSIPPPSTYPIFTDCGPYVDAWIRNYGGSNTEVARSILETSDGGFIIGGHTLSDDVDLIDNNGGVDFWLVKTDVNGNIEWEKVFGGSSPDTGKCVQETPDGGFIFIGNAISSDGDVGGTAGSFDAFVLKLDATGNIQWKNLYGGSNTDNPEWIEPTPDGGYIITGLTASSDGDITNNQGIFDCWLLKIDAMGNTIWSRTYGGSLEDAASFVQNTTDGGFILTGNTYSFNGDIPTSNGDLDAIFMKFDAMGNIEFTRNFGGSGMDFGECTRQTLDGGYIITGVTGSFDGDFVGNHGSKDAFLIKLDAAGNTEWTQLYGGGAEDGGTEILCNTDGTYTLGGYSFSIGAQVSNNNGLGDIWVIKIDANGVILSEDTFGGSMTENLQDMRFTQSGGIIMCGFTESSDIDFPGNNGQGDFWAALFSVPPVAPPIANLGADILDLCKGTMITLDATDENCPDCTYIWQDAYNSPSRTLSVNATKAYDVTITNSVGCTAVDNLVVSVSTLGSAVTNVVNPSCSNLGLIETTAFGGTGTYSYAWDNSETTSDIYDLEAGEYTISVSDGNCTVSEMFMLAQTGGTPPEVDLGANQSICGGQLVTLDAQNNGSTYEWNANPNLNTQTLDITTAGTYTVVVTNQAGCTSSSSITIDEFTAPTLELGTNIATCDTQVQLSSNTTNVTYAWSTMETTADINVSATDSYSLTITDMNGCTTSDAIEVTLNPTPVFDLGQAQTSCIGVNLNANIANVDYNWSTGGSAASIEAAATDWYYLTVTDGNTCTATDSVFVEIVDNLTVNLGEDTTAGCSSVNLDTNLPNLNYVWESGEITQTLEVTATNWYAVTVTDGDGCSANDSIFVTIHPDLELDLGESQITSCTNITLDANQTNLSYDWSTEENSQTIEVNTSGVYSLLATDQNGCTAEASVDVIIANDLEIDLGQDLQSCSTVTLEAPIQNATYQWFDVTNNQAITNINDTQLIENTGQYALTVINADGCSDTDTINVTIATELNISLGPDTESCIPVTLNADATINNASYVWQDVNTSEIVGNTPNFEASTSSVYALLVTDSEGCTAMDSVQVTINNDLTLDLGSDIMSCGEVEIQTGNPDAEHEWSPSTDTTSTIMVTTSGTVAVTITDDNGCTASDSLMVIISEDLSLEVEQSNISCNGANDGSINLLPTGGAGAYNYDWAGDQTGATLTNLPEGMYSVTLTDDGGCTLTENITITELPAVSATLNAAMIDCANAETTISVEANGGSGEYTYTWNNTSTEPTLDVNAVGTYEVTVSDANDCSVTESIDITASMPLVIELDNVVNNNCPNDALGSISVNVLEGNGNYTYNWSNLSTGNTFSNQDPTIENLEGATWEIIVSDADGCTDALLVEVEAPAPFSPSLQVSNGCGSNGSASLQLNGGTMPYNYAWNTGENTADIFGLTTGTYTVEVTDNNGCTLTESITIENNEPVEFDVDATPISCNGETDATISITPTNGVAPFEYEWSSGQNSESIDNLSEGIYTLFLNDANDCLSVETFSINEPTVLDMDVQISTNNTIKTIFVTPVGGTAPYTISWSGGNTGPILENPTLSSYTVTVTDAHGCSTIQEVNATSTSISDADFIQGFDVFPNPNQGQFVVNVELEQSIATTIQVRNTLGQILASQNFNTNSIQTSINLNNAPKGFYFVEVRGAQQSVFKKVVVQ